MTDIGSSAARLEPFLLMSKSAKGAAAAKLIQDVTSAPGVFVFAELLALPNIQELASNPQYTSSYALLHLFSYKTFEEYARTPSSYPTLSPAQIAKLKYLSLATYALSHRILPYATLQAALDVPSIRALEDIIIDAMYADIIRGKLDQKREHFEVEWVMGRDLAPTGAAAEALLTDLQNWSKTTATLLAHLDSTILSVQDSQTAQKATLEQHAEQQQKALAEVVAAQKSHNKEGASSSSSALRARRENPGGGFGGNVGNLVGDDKMEVDETAASWDFRKKKSDSQTKSGTRKRNRF